MFVPQQLVHKSYLVTHTQTHTHTHTHNTTAQDRIALYVSYVSQSAVYSNATTDFPDVIPAHFSSAMDKPAAVSGVCACVCVRDCAARVGVCMHEKLSMVAWGVGACCGSFYIVLRSSQLGLVHVLSGHKLHISSDHCPHTHTHTHTHSHTLTHTHSHSHSHTRTCRHP